MTAFLDENSGNLFADYLKYFIECVVLAWKIALAICRDVFIALSGIVSLGAMGETISKLGSYQ